MLRAQLLDLPNGETRVDRAVPFPQNHARVLDGFGLEAAPDFVRIPEHHVVERHAHLVGGVSPEMLIGKKQNLFAALPRPLQRRRGVRRGADDAAPLAAERFDRRRGVDVRDRNDSRLALVSRPACLPRLPARSLPFPRARASTSRAARAPPCPTSSSRPRGREESPADARALSTSALSAMKWTPQNTMNSASGCCAT